MSGYGVFADCFPIRKPEVIYKVEKATCPINRKNVLAKFSLDGKFVSCCFENKNQPCVGCSLKLGFLEVKA